MLRTFVKLLVVLSMMGYALADDSHKVYSRCEKYQSVNPDKPANACARFLTRTDCEAKKYCFWYEVGPITSNSQNALFDLFPGSTRTLNDLNDGRIVQVSTSVFSSTYAQESVSVIVTPTGKIIWVDTGFGTNVTLMRISLFQAAIGSAFAPGNLAAIIYEEGHTEHINQAQTLLNYFGQTKCAQTGCLDGQVMVIGSTELVSYVQDMQIVRPVVLNRGLKTLGQLVPDMDPAFGTYTHFYPYEPPSSVLVVPSTFIPHTPISPPTTLTIAGLPLVFIVAEGDSRDAMIVWMPTEQVVFVNDIFFGTLVNVGTIRGESPRNPRNILTSLTAIMNLNPRVVVTGHMPAWGPIDPFSVDQATVHQILQEVVWAFTDVHTQTLALINAGLTDYETISRTVDINYNLHPYTYANSAYWTPWAYGGVQNVVRGICEYYIGYFDGFGADLWAFTRDEKIAFMLEMAGSVEHMVNKAKKHLTALNEDLDTRMTSVAWAMRLSGYAIHYELGIFGTDDYNEDLVTEAERIYTDAARILGLNSQPQVWRNFYLTEYYDPASRVY